MELREFLEILGHTPYEWYWQRRTLIETPTLRARDKNGYCYCPLTAVCGYLTGYRVDVSEPFRAARKLGMRDDVARSIVEASDRGALHHDDKAMPDRALYKKTIGRQEIPR